MRGITGLNLRVSTLTPPSLLQPLLSRRAEKGTCLRVTPLQFKVSRMSSRAVGGDAGVDTAAPAASTAAEAVEEEVIVQYVVLRRDLIDTWPMGSVVTQGCHASVAAVWENKDDPHTLSYCSPSNLPSMHKVTLEVKGETQLVNLSEKLKAAAILHKLWIEMPENYPTCLATKPYPKSQLSPFFKKLKLCK